jgi:hypothetical protein
MLILILSFLFFALVFFTEDGLSNDTVLIYIMLLALYALLCEIKNSLKHN